MAKRADRLALPILDHLTGARYTAQMAVIGQLHTFQPPIRTTGETDQVRSDLCVGVIALIGVLGEDTGHTQINNPLCVLRWQLASQIEKLTTPILPHLAGQLTVAVTQ